MKKLISFVLSLALALSALSVSAFAYTPEELAALGIYAPEISNLGTAATTANAGGKAVITLNFVRANVMETTGVSLALTDSDELTLAEGSDNISSVNYSQDYRFTFSVPTTYTHAKQTVVFSLSYSYLASGGITKSETKKLSYDIAINENAGVSEITVENLLLAESEIANGGTASVSFDVFNNRSSALTELVMTVEDSTGKELDRKYVRTVNGLSSSSYTLTAPELKTAGKNELFLVLTYKNASGTEKTEKYAFNVNVKAKEALESNVRIENAAFENSSVFAGEKSSLAFDLINTGKGTATELTINVKDGKNVVLTKFIGTLAAESTQTITLAVPSFEETGEKKLTIEAAYTDEGKKLSVKDTISLSILESTKLSIRNVSYQKKALAEADNTVTFNLINRGDEDFKTCQAYLYNGDKLVGTTFIGAAAAQSQSPVTITYNVAEAANTTLTLKVTYKNTAEKLLSSSESFSVEIYKDEVKNASEGYLKIQSIKLPLGAAKNTQVSLPVYITNPTDVEIVGAELTAYDETGNAVDSIYVSSVPAKSSAEFSFTVSSKTAGAHSYTIGLAYTNKSGEAISDKSSTVSVEFADEKSEEGGEKYPASLKIQKIKNLTNIYTNVKTDNTVVLVNAGKGAASNVEYYLTDESGKEIAREYIGTIPAASSMESTYSVKFTETANYPLTLNVEYFNDDGSKETVTRSYEQNVIDYRASITDIAGLEWVMSGNAATLEFTVLNNGTETLLNTTAYLRGEDGTSWGQLYIGTIEAGSKKERQRIKNLFLSTPDGQSGEIPLSLVVEYENADMQIFSFSAGLNAHYEYMNYEDMGGYDDGGMIVDDSIQYDENGNPIDPANAEAQGLEWWIWALIIGGGVLVVVIVLVIVLRHAKKKKSEKDDDDDMEYLNMLTGSGSDKK